jgi:hypothetical protein
MSAFTNALMKKVADPKAVFKHAIATAVASHDEPNRGFFGGLVSGAHERDPELGKSLVKQTLRSPKLRSHAIAIIGSGSLESDEISIVISLLQSGDIQPWECQNLGLSRVDVKVLLPLLRELENYGTDGLWTILLGIVCLEHNPPAITHSTKCASDSQFREVFVPNGSNSKESDHKTIAR